MLKRRRPITSEIAPKRAFRDKGPGCPAAILVSATVAIQCPNDLRKTLRIEQRMPSANVSVTLRRIGAGQSWPKSCPATGRNERFVIAVTGRLLVRSEERRGGKGWFSTGRSRGSP